MRGHYALIGKNKESVAAIMELSLNNNSDVPNTVKRAYYAAAEMASAQYKISPVAKINVFNSGKKILEAAISADTTNLEARYIRFTIQQNAPSFLGYNKKCDSDKAFLIKNLASIKNNDSELFSNVYAYLLTYNKLSESDKTTMLN